MKSFLSTALILLINTAIFCQSDNLIAGQQEFENELLQKYKKLKAVDEERILLDKMKPLSFFPFDSTLRVRALLDTTSTTDFLPMKTSRGRAALYRRYGYLSFSIRGHSFRMPVYQAKSAVHIKSDELFFPFTDNTNGETTYGGGRYIDLRIPVESWLVLDFNRAYNPYCAYSHLYSCEIPPDENNFTIPIEAGLKY